MNKIYFFVISLLSFFSCQNDSISSSLLLNSKIEDSINSLINKMTIEEKVGQTCLLGRGTYRIFLVRPKIAILINLEFPNYSRPSDYHQSIRLAESVPNNHNSAKVTGKSVRYGRKREKCWTNSMGFSWDFLGIFYRASKLYFPPYAHQHSPSHTSKYLS